MGRLLPAGIVLLMTACGSGSRHSSQQAATGSASHPLPVADAECEHQDPAAVVETFYAAYLQHHSRGLPTTEEMKTYAPMFSRELVGAIERARGRQKQFIAAHPREKPPFIEGSLFGSLFEGITAVESVDAKPGVIPTTVSMRFLYDDSSNQAVRWSDEAILRCELGQWRIDDVQYGGGWEFSPKGRLRAALEAD
jgi:hypothetical protein